MLSRWWHLSPRSPSAGPPSQPHLWPHAVGDAGQHQGAQLVRAGQGHGDLVPGEVAHVVVMGELQVRLPPQPLWRVLHQGHSRVRTTCQGSAQRPGGQGRKENGSSLHSLQSRGPWASGPEPRFSTGIQSHRSHGSSSTETSKRKLFTLSPNLPLRGLSQQTHKPAAILHMLRPKPWNHLWLLCFYPRLKPSANTTGLARRARAEPHHSTPSTCCPRPSHGLSSACPPPPSRWPLSRTAVPF